MTLYLQTKSKDRLHGYSVWSYPLHGKYSVTCTRFQPTHTLNLLAQEGRFDRHDFTYMMSTLFFSFLVSAHSYSRDYQPHPYFYSIFTTLHWSQTHQKTEGSTLGARGSGSQWLFLYSYRIYFCTYLFEIFEAGCNNLDQVLYSPVYIASECASVMCLFTTFFLRGRKSDLPVIAVLFLNIN